MGRMRRGGEERGGRKVGGGRAGESWRAVASRYYWKHTCKLILCGVIFEVELILQKKFLTEPKL